MYGRITTFGSVSVCVSVSMVPVASVLAKRGADGGTLLFPAAVVTFRFYIVNVCVAKW